MSDLKITGNDVTQAMSQLLVEVATGRNVNKSQLDKVINASDATVRAAMREMRELDAEVSSEFLAIMSKPAD